MFSTRVISVATYMYSVFKNYANLTQSKLSEECLVMNKRGWMFTGPHYE